MTGFPNDVKERELNNMLRFMPGYEASQMNWKNGQVRPPPFPRHRRHACMTGAAVAVADAAAPCNAVTADLQAQGFALFYTGVAARAACSALAGLR